MSFAPWRPAAVLLALLMLAGCGPTRAATGVTGPTRSAAPSPTRPRPAGVVLVPHTLLTARFAVPAGWRAASTVSGPGDGQATYTDPNAPYTVYVEVSSCAACVDQGLVTAASANGVADPAAVARGLPGILATQPAGSAAVLYTARGDVVGSVTHGVVRVLFNSGGVITGYVRLAATLPAGQAAVAARIVASLHATGG